MNDMEQLREDVRATAPQPRPEFAARLERDVEAGFKPARAARPPRRERRISLWGPGIALACTALIAVVVALGAASGTGDDDEAASGGGAAAPAPQEGRPTGGGGGDAAQSAPPPSSPDLLAGAESFARDAAPGDRRVRGRDGNRVVEQSTALELETNADDFTEVSDDVLRVADESGSIVQTSNVTEENGRGYARYDLRVPASRLEETMAALSRLAHVTSRTASSQDITRSYVSATDRLDDARAERRSLLKALERADTDVEAEAIRRQIAIARDRIAVATRDVQALQRRADRAKVSVTVRSTGKRSEGGAWTPGDAVGDAGRILEVAAGVVVVTAAALAPVAVLAILFGLAARTLRRRRRDAALGPAS